MAKTDYELVQECINGDTFAFEELLGRYKNLVYSVVLRMVNDSEDANDIAQEVFIKVYKNISKYSPEFKFSTWIIKIATNSVIDFRRKKKPECIDIDDMVFEPSGNETPETSYIEGEGKRELSSAIEKLPDMYKVPIVLYHIEDMSYQEISEAVGISLSKVKNRIFRGRKILKDIIISEKEGGKP
ncbi:sigma-70 family RNA polymerase sigma factor [Anaerotignum faecicola]|nr:sigma-70 family RNA polymerase sigma factor [Anaerotignum faecicola]